MRTAATSASEALERLLDRYDPDAIDVPGGRARVRLAVEGEGDWDVVIRDEVARLEPAGARAPDALLSADAATWERIGRDLRGGMAAHRRGRLRVRRNLHLGVGLLAATGGDEPGRLRFASLRAGSHRIAYCEAGRGEPLVCLHGLGGTKASFLPTLAGLAERHRVIAVDLPGFGDSAKPIGAPYDARFFARSLTAFLDELGLERVHLAGNSMGGRVALEVGLTERERVGGLALLSPALAWRRESRWAPVLRLVRPELGLLQLAPRPVVEGFVRRMVPGASDGWAAAGVDEFLRAYLTPRGRAAFYAAGRNILLDEPEGEDGFWTRLRRLECDSLFVWGRRDGLVPIAFRRHVEKAVPRAEHLVLNCGHVPQVERPRELNAALGRFLAERPLPRSG